MGSLLGTPPHLTVDQRTGHLGGDSYREEVRRLSDLKGLFEAEPIRRKMDLAQIVYSVQSYRPVEDGTLGGLIYGTTFVQPGSVGGEYFMTRGHFHAERDTAEFYWCHQGNGLLLLMAEDRTYRIEQVQPGSVHYVPGCTAHRLVNTGATILAVGACWQSISGHDYEAVRERGFPARIFEGPRLVEVG